MVPKWEVIRVEHVEPAAMRGRTEVRTAVGMSVLGMTQMVARMAMLGVEASEKVARVEAKWVEAIV